jgi:membrane-bound metal-dependent hydrolase YbcI (DUF457 family)
LLIKGAAPRAFSWSTFVLTQVLIDCETLYKIAQRRYQLHRELHTFAGATLVGVGAALLALGARRFAPRLGGSEAAGSELSPRAVWLGGLVGGASHPFLDGLMHDDVQPFMPWSTANPFLGLVDLGLLHVGCLVAGVVGAALLLRRASAPK